MILSASPRYSSAHSTFFFANIPECGFSMITLKDPVLGLSQAYSDFFSTHHLFRCDHCDGFSNRSASAESCGPAGWRLKPMAVDLSGSTEDDPDEVAKCSASIVYV